LVFSHNESAKGSRRRAARAITTLLMKKDNI